MRRELLVRNAVGCVPVDCDESDRHCEIGTRNNQSDRGVGIASGHDDLNVWQQRLDPAHREQPRQ